MIDEIYKNIYRIHVPLTGNPLKELNSYFIKGKSRGLLIDTGFRREECRDALISAVKKLGAKLGSFDVALTHMHADHSGNSDAFAADGVKFYMSETDIRIALGSVTAKRRAKRFERYTVEGLPEEIIKKQVSENPAFKEWIKDPEKLNFVPMHDGDIIDLGDFKFTWVYVPGHTPGNSMLYEADKKIMFTGDHILFTITPNITYWPDMDDALGSYLENLKKAREYKVEFAFPGHREFADYNYYERIDALLSHHERRLAEALQVITDNPGSCAYDIAGKMTWKIKANSWDEFPSTQKWFAIGEALSHIDYLMLRNKIRKEKREDGLWGYYKI